MACILHIETSTAVCSIALSDNESVVFSKENHEGMSHASILGLFTEEAMRFARENGKQLDAVAVSCGPGSYTGLRIGVSTAKGLCYGLDIPLIAIPTLQILTVDALHKLDFADYLYCPMIDARRMEVYSALFVKNFTILKDVSAEIIDKNSFADELLSRKIVFFGTGAEKCKAVIKHPNAVFAENIHPLAKNMLSLSEEKFHRKAFEDVAYFEPFYLKDFVATTPKNKVF